MEHDIYFRPTARGEDENGNMLYYSLDFIAIYLASTLRYSYFDVEKMFIFERNRLFLMEKERQDLIAAKYKT